MKKTIEREQVEIRIAAQSHELVEKLIERFLEIVPNGYTSDISEDTRRGFGYRGYISLTLLNGELLVEGVQ